MSGYHLLWQSKMKIFQLVNKKNKKLIDKIPTSNISLDQNIANIGQYYKINMSICQIILSNLTLIILMGEFFFIEKISFIQRLCSMLLSAFCWKISMTCYFRISCLCNLEIIADSPCILLSILLKISMPLKTGIHTLLDPLESQKDTKIIHYQT